MVILLFRTGIWKEPLKKSHLNSCETVACHSAVAVGEVDLYVRVDSVFNMFFFLLQELLNKWGKGIWKNNNPTGPFSFGWDFPTTSIASCTFNPPLTTVAAD
jgi:hypothetical protein